MPVIENSQAITVGDWVSICAKGGLNGQQVQVRAIEGDQATVTRPGWVVEQTYPLSELRRVAASA